MPDEASSGVPVRVVVVGGGFGGLACVRSLALADVELTLVDRENHHLFQPLLYQVATAGLSPADIAWPVRSLLRRQRNATVLMAEVTAIDLERRVVHHSAGQSPFDKLVIATGATHSYFGHQEWSEHAFGLKTLNDATAMRSRILTAFERAETCTDLEEQKAWLTIVIVGGGPTGVEMAGSLAELTRRSLATEFRSIDPASTRIVLVEAVRVLPAFPLELGQAAVRSLERLGVEVWEGRAVTGSTADGVQVGDDLVACKSVVWAAGVEASPAARWLGAQHDRSGRVTVDDHCRVVGLTDVFAIGDTAAFPTEDGHGLPGVAQVAMQQGRFVAATIAGRASGPFVYHDLGTMATIGRRSAVAVIKGRHYSGFVAWFAWSFIHLASLVTAQSKVLVFVQWMWAYATFARGARLITRLESQPRAPGGTSSG